MADAQTVKPASSTATVVDADDELRAQYAHFDRHINRLSRRRVPSPLKDILQFISLDGMISLAGGLPHSSLFPFDSVHVSTYDSATRMAMNPSEIAKVDVCVEKQPSSHSTDLRTTLQYGPFNGIKPIMDWMHAFVERVYAPGYAGWQLLMDGGSTDGWAKVAGMLLDEGDTILVETHTFPSSQALWVPMGVTAVPIDIDMYGLVPEALARTLDNWEARRPNERKPKTLYCVPVGHNPTGSTLAADRKQEIYEICVKYDIIIVEDDPYYFLQLPQYQPGGDRALPLEGPTPDAFLAGLVPTFLHFDREGRVIRLETVSKTLAPGFRLGFIISNPFFHERLGRATEVLTQTASGWSQAVFCELVHTWGQDGYVRWLAGISETYTVRRNWMRTQRLFRFVPPSSGMFLWIDVDLRAHPAWDRISAPDTLGLPGEEVWATAFWRKLLDARILLAPGTYNKPWQGEGRSAMANVPGHAFFRLTYSSTPQEEMDEGIRRMAQVFRENWSA
uniref:Aminotransferase class I/classII large domain-containing protein n=1 Tax=Schizophyllum commune (strain H4-8 / FGSC 9210) TaxID=578458 RepID=D8Q4E7_SCHCM